MEEHYTLSQLTSILARLEEELGKEYIEKAGTIEDRRVKEVLKELGETHLERAETLTKTAQETVVEMTLEPITLPTLTAQIDSIKEALKKEDPIHAAAETEEKIENLYREISPKIAHVSGDISTLLKTFAKDSGRKRRSLKS